MSLGYPMIWLTGLSWPYDVKWLHHINTPDGANIHTFNFFLLHSLFCRALQLCSLGNLDHAVLSINISLDSSIRHEPPIHKTSFCHQHAEWDSFSRFFFALPHWMKSLGYLCLIRFLLGRSWHMIAIDAILCPVVIVANVSSSRLSWCPLRYRIVSHKFWFLRLLAAL